MGRKWFCFLLILCMLTTLLPVMTVAAATIEVGTEEALINAISDADDGDTIKLTEGITLTAVVTIDKQLTLDLNGFTITGSAGDAAISIVSGGDLTITDSKTGGTGKITSALTRTIALSGNGKLTVNGGTIANTIKGASKSCIDHDSTDTVTINNGTVTASNYAILVQQGVLNINGGLVSSTDSTGIYVKTNKNVTISGGTVRGEGPAQAIYNYGRGLITISGTAIVTSAHSRATIYILYGPVGGTALDIQGGTIRNTGVGAAIYNDDDTKISISGGTVTSKTTTDDALCRGTISLAGSSNDYTQLDIQGGTISNTAASDDKYAVYKRNEGNVIIGTGATIIGNLYPSVQTPAVQSAAMYKAAVIAPSVGFALTNSAEYSESAIWSVYNADTGNTAPSDVTASVTGNILTLSHSSDLPAGDYYVAVSDRANGKGESKRLKLTVLELDFPGAPTNVTATAGDAKAVISFAPPASNGGGTITDYTVTAYFENGSATGITATGSESPITVTGLTNGTPYIFNVTATNNRGAGPASDMSNSITPLEEAPPTATVQPITGTLRFGETLTGHYTYTDVNGDLEGTSTFKWYRSDDASGLNKEEIAGANSITYVLTSADIGKHISFEVTPVAATGNSPGSAVESALAGPVEPIIITLSAIPGITAPAAGMVPDTTVDETEEYTATITWSPANSPFERGTVYTATITITPKTGYTLTGIPANFFTVAGATATNAADSGVVTAVFPETDPMNYTVTFDVNGGTAVAPISNVASGSAITAPTAPIKAGYTFAGWYKESTFANAWDFDFDVVTANITLYAKWTAVTPPPPSNDSYTPPAPINVIKSGETVTAWNLDQLVSLGKTLTVDAENGAKLVFDTAALKGINNRNSENIKVEVKDVSSEHRDNLPDKMVFSLTVSAGSNTISDFGGKVTVSLPYVLREGQRAEDVTVWYLADDGTMTEIPCTYDPETKLATFTVTHFSLYVVGVAEKTWINPFTDIVESDWFYSAVKFANQNGLFAGTGATTFSPHSPMTRAMLWTVVGRLDGQTLSGSNVYIDARNWAMGAGITDGTDPDGSITREQIVTILWRYIGSPKIHGDLSRFADASNVSGYALNAMAWAVEKGIIVGSNGALVPQDKATRAQVAAIIQRYIENNAK